MESTVVACIAGVVTLVGAILSNSKSRAVVEASWAPSRPRSRSYEPWHITCRHGEY